jgi:hypothetical protein
MMGGPATEVFALETYPLDNAVITEAFPPTQTLCVRRTAHAPFLAVWDAWKEQPNLKSVEVATNRIDALRVSSATHVYYLAFGPGVAEFSDGLRFESDGAFTLVRDRDGVTLVHATTCTIEASGAASTIRMAEPATLSIAWKGSEPEIRLDGDIAYDTRGGEDHPRTVPSVTPTLEGNWLGQGPAPQ